ncbi:MAG: response regulator [Gammaproteobacteria bacterium]
MQSILLVDDKKENLIALESLLDRPDLELLKADNGNDGLRLLLKHEVALVLLDVQMPGMSGFEMAELMRRNKKTQSVPVIFVTANGDKRDVFRGYELGAVDFLSKPIQRDILLSKVNVFLELDRQKRDLALKLAEIERLKHQNEMLLHALGDAVIAVDAQGIIGFVNPAMEHIFHLDTSGLVGKPVNELLFQNAEGVKTAWGTGKIHAATSRGDRLPRTRHYFVKTTAGLVEAEIHASPVASADQEFAGAVITLRAILPEEAPDASEHLAKQARRHTRRKIGVVLRVFDRTTGRNLGRLTNISMDGFKLAGREEITPGRLYEVSMILPEPLAGSNTLSFDARAVWSQPSEDSAGEVCAGFRIVAIGGNDNRVLAQMIERF